MIKTIHPGRRFGTVQISASKSDAQRACLAAALANGVSVLKGIGNSDDERAMLAAIECLGAEILASGNDLRITGISSFPDHAVLNAGESGLGIRLLTPVCASQPGTFTIEGRGSLTGRPMHFFEEVLPQFGAQCTTQSGFLPLHTFGPMQGGTAKVNASLSSQFVSGLLMALPLAGGDSILQVEQLNSRPYVNMTLNTLSAFGITINETNGVFRIPGNQRYQPTNYTIEADWSSAGYWLVAAALGHELTVQGVQMNSLQADKALIGFLETAGCRVDQTEDGIIVNGATKQSFTVDATDCPDLFPTLVVLAAACNGISEIHGAKRLEHKESHRGLSLQSEFAKLGVRIDLNNDTMLVYGTGKITGGTVTSHHDHRIAMSLAIAATIAEGPVTIEHAEAVAKSYTDFWKTLDSL